MTRATPAMLVYLQRVVRHEFAAAQQFTLQAVLARATEAAAVRLYRDAARACLGVEPLRCLFELIGAEEEIHRADLTQRLRQAGEPNESRGS